MKEQIQNHIDDPKQLERLYRENKPAFKKSFESLYPEIAHHPAARVWHERLSYEHRDISWGTKEELIIVVILAFIGGLIARIPFFSSLKPEYFYPRNIAFIVFPMLSTYFAWKQSLALKKVALVFAITLAAAVYINMLPLNPESDTLMLACIHLPIFMWTMLGFVFTGNQYKSIQKRIGFLRFNGDLIVMTVIILLAGAALSAITINLFMLINIHIEQYYFENFAVWGLAAAPVFGAFLVEANPQLVKNVSPVIARVFTPLVLVMLVAYLIAIIYTGKDPYNDREFLLLFNLLLIGVMAIILFSLAENTKDGGNKLSTLLLFALSVVTIIVNGIALSAIVFRIAEYGVTPNRLAVMGSNLLILSNLLIVSYRLFWTLRDKNQIESVDKSIAMFLPFYSLWTMVVVFLFPVLFGFK